MKTNAALIRRLNDVEAEAEALARLAEQAGASELLLARLFVAADEIAAKLAQHRQAIEAAQASG